MGDVSTRRENPLVLKILEAELFACTVNTKAPASVGAPERSPVSDNVVPVGICPENIEYVTPLVASSILEKDTSVAASSRTVSVFQMGNAPMFEVNVRSAFKFPIFVRAADTVNVKAPVDVGMPDKSPTDDRDIPGGSCPKETL